MSVQMPGAYLYRVSPDLIEMFIKKVFIKRVIINDAADGEGGEYLTVLNGFGFRVQDPDPAVDSSNAIATTLANDINASSLDLSATATDNTVQILSGIRGKDFSIETKTSDDGGTITYRSEKAEAYAVRQADNWDETFDLLETVPHTGLTSSSAPTALQYNDMQLEDKYVPFRFSPTEYALVDDDVLYFKTFPIVDGIEITDASSINIVLGHSQYRENQPALILTGAVPIAANVYDALTFVLPLQTSSFNFTNNDGTESVWLGFGRGSGEIPVGPGDSWNNNSLGTPMISIRTDAGAATPASITAVAILMTLH